MKIFAEVELVYTLEELLRFFRNPPVRRRGEAKGALVGLTMDSAETLGSIRERASGVVQLVYLSTNNPFLDLPDNVTGKQFVARALKMGFELCPQITAATLLRGMAEGTNRCLDGFTIASKPLIWNLFGENRQAWFNIHYSQGEEACDSRYLLDLCGCKRSDGLLFAAGKFATRK